MQFSKETKHTEQELWKDCLASNDLLCEGLHLTTPGFDLVEVNTKQTTNIQLMDVCMNHLWIAIHFPAFKWNLNKYWMHLVKLFNQWITSLNILWIHMNIFIWFICILNSYQVNQMNTHSKIVNWIESNSIVNTNESIHMMCWIKMYT